MATEEDNRCSYLGFDLGTQKLKVVQMNGKLVQLFTADVEFDKDLPEFGTVGGFCAGPKPNEYFVHPAMWISAVDIVLSRLVKNGADLSTVCAISGSGQQHGSVYWLHEGIETLRSLDPDIALNMQLNEKTYSVKESPIWMDGTTEIQCIEMEAAIGGPTEMAKITGSKCHPRFTGPQIRRIYQQNATAYESTKRISLVSSFLASVFLGDVAPIDYADASGMNLFDIKSKTWSKACLDACAPDLQRRLGEAVKTSAIVGSINNYFVKRFGFAEACKVVAFTGDNPSALSGMLPDKNWLVMSLGTSDTLIVNLKEPPILEEGHVFCHPTETNEYMGMLCFRNGSLVRTDFKDEHSNKSWETFNEMLDSTPCGNDGQMALHFPAKEINPTAKGVLRWSKDHSAASPDASIGVDKFDSPQIEIRALIEGQMLQRCAMAVAMGFDFGDDTKIIVTGGTSLNKSILQVISDVFNAPVYTQNASSEAALMGAAYRAKYALYINGEEARQSAAAVSYHDYILKDMQKHVQLACQPKKGSKEIYAPMFERYREMAKILMAENKSRKSSTVQFEIPRRHSSSSSSNRYE